jgi:hypothetical protein
VTLLRRIARRVQRELVGVGPLTHAERLFRAANRAYWSRHLDHTARRPRGYVLIEPVFHPLMLLENANMAATIAVERDLGLLFLLPNPFARRLREMLSSYPRSSFEYVVDLRGDLIRLVQTLIEAWRVYRALQTPEDILDLRIDGIEYGDLVYDTVLQMGYATIDRVDLRTLRQLWAFFYYRSKILQILDKRQIVAAAITGRHSTEAGTLTRHLLERRVEIVLRSGPTIFAAAKYRTPADAKVFEFRPDQRYVDLVLRRRSDLIDAADAYLRGRLANQVDPSNDGLAFDQRKRVFRSKEAFAAAYGLDPSKPFVFVMIHVFNDHPHYLERLLFRDYYQWFLRTLDLAGTAKHVNWVFKEHPGAIYYYTRDTDSQRLEELVRSRSLTFLSSTADFNAASLPFLAHAVVTCIGTAGLEYSALGIPCVLAGTSPYSGFGFTIEPPSVDAYFDVLRHIDQLTPLTEEQRTVAKLVAYLYLHVLNEPRDPFFRHYRFEEIMRASSDAVWADAAKILSQSNYETLDAQVRTVRDFIRRPEFTQYVDFARFPVLREALDRVGAS